MLHSSSLRKAAPDPGNKRRFRRIAVSPIALFALGLSDSLLAQEAGEATGAPGAEGASNVVVTQPFPWLGAFVVVVLAGLCLFAVCRSSRRN